MRERIEADNPIFAKFCIILFDRSFAAFFGVIKLINHLERASLYLSRVGEHTL